METIVADVVSKNTAARLVLYLDMADLAFKKYLPGKFLLHALCIRKSNEAVYKLLSKYAASWPQELHTDIVQLLNHYDIWFAQFDDFRSNNRFALNDPFVFHHLDDQSAFPRQSVANIYDYCKRVLAA